MSTKTPYSLVYNSRFYILVSSFLLSVIIAAALRLNILSDQLYYIRTEQVFGLIGILYWYVALIISPLGYVIGKEKLRGFEFARRAIGVSAAYFALLHVSVAVWGQLGGLGAIQFLPDIFKLSITGGIFALMILLIMALTSLDKVVDFMTFTRWKWLHRLVYAGGILAVLHIWSIGTHVEYTWIQALAFLGLALLAILETYRTMTLLRKRYSFLRDTSEFITIYVIACFIFIGAIASIPLVVDSYHTSQHTESGRSVMSEEPGATN